LAPEVIELLSSLFREDGNPHLFIGSRTGSGLSNMSMTALLRRMGHGDITVHGFRSTFRDWAAEQTNFPREVAEMALAHTIDSKVEAAYRRGDLLKKRRQLAEAWARYCGSPPVEKAEKADNVVPMHAVVR
jgi:integrase